MKEKDTPLVAETPKGKDKDTPTTSAPPINAPTATKEAAPPVISEAILAATFAANPECAYLYFNAQGQAFFTEAAAQDAAAPLPNPQVIRIDNPQHSKE